MDWEAFYNRFREPNFIPGYEIQNRLGGGAFGEVYKARKHSIGKAYAIKFLKIDDEAQRDAVERELEQVRHFAAIDHPNLVTIEDLGTALSVPYLIMGYAGEDTLARRLKQASLEPASALSTFVQVCRGVLALHDRRLVHFDLKPSNVFLKGDVARVGDYGLSKMMTDGRLTLSFGRGTPQYMAPEMIRNRADHRADIYSLGVILFECFARRPPFEAVVPGTIAIREVDTPPVFPPEFPAVLRPVVERCLRLAPEDRYPGVAELLEELGQTARPGDSVRFPVPVAAGGAPLAATTGAPPRNAEPGAARGSSTTAAVPSEARQTAAELARGAVEVARGVWDGIRTASGPRAPGAAAPPARTESERAPPPQFETPEPRPAPGTPPPLPPARMPPPAPGASATADRGASLAFEPRSGADGDGAAVATIPVPPEVRGGVLGTLVATLALGLEVLVAVARGLWSVFPRLVSGARSTGGAGARLFTRALRFALFVLVLAVLGGVTTWIALSILGSR